MKTHHLRHVEPKTLIFLRLFCYFLTVFGVVDTFYFSVAGVNDGRPSKLVENSVVRLIDHFQLHSAFQGPSISRSSSERNW
ncbi:hypothetical protein ACS0TY_012937 [Phlomoides rotata]